MPLFKVVGMGGDVTYVAASRYAYAEAQWMQVKRKELERDPKLLPLIIEYIDEVHVHFTADMNKKTDTEPPKPPTDWAPVFDVWTEQDQAETEMGRAKARVKKLRHELAHAESEAAHAEKLYRDKRYEVKMSQTSENQVDV